MVKQYLFIIIILSGFSILDAQSKWTKGATLSFGLSGERTHETKELNSYKRIIESKLMPAFGSGFWLERSLGERLGIELAINYAYLQHFNRRSEKEYLSTNRIRSIMQNDRKYLIHQLNAPLQLNYYFIKKDKNIVPFLSIGAKYSYTLSVEEKQKATNQSASRNTINFFDKKYSADKNSHLLNQDPFSISIGFGLDFGAFRFEINRTQYALKENEVFETLDPLECLCFSSQVRRSIPSVHSTMVSIKYKM